MSETETVQVRFLSSNGACLLAQDCPSTADSLVVNIKGGLKTRIKTASPVSAMLTAADAAAVVRIEGLESLPALEQLNLYNLENLPRLDLWFEIARFPALTQLAIRSKQYPEGVTRLASANSEEIYAHLVTALRPAPADGNQGNTADLPPASTLVRWDAPPIEPLPTLTSASLDAALCAPTQLAQINHAIGLVNAVPAGALAYFEAEDAFQRLQAADDELQWGSHPAAHLRKFIELCEKNRFKKMSEAYAREMIAAMLAYCVPLSAHCIKLNQAAMALQDLEDALKSINKHDVIGSVSRTDVLHAYAATVGKRAAAQSTGNDNEAMPSHVKMTIS